MVPTLSLICVSQTLNFSVSLFFIPHNSINKNQLPFSFLHHQNLIEMGEGKNQNYNKDHHLKQKWDVMEEEADKYKHEHKHPCSSNEEACSTISDGSSSSITCCSSSSSSDTTDDASSSSANSSRSSLYDLSDLMSQLPIKRGLSKFYHGKSDSFSSLARVTSVEDLPKKEHKMKKKMKKSYRSHTLPKPIISKRKSRGYLKKKFGSSSMKKKIDE